MKKFPNQSSLKRWNFHCSSVQTTTTELKYFILLSMVKWLPSERCVAAFWESWSMRLIRLLYYDCRRVVKCSVLSSIGLCHSEKYCIRASTGSLSPSLFLTAALHPPYSKRLFSWERLSWQSVQFVLLALFFSSPCVSSFLGPFTLSITLYLSSYSLPWVCYLSHSLSLFFSLSLLCERPERLTAAH